MRTTTISTSVMACCLVSRGTATPYNTLCTATELTVQSAPGYISKRGTGTPARMNPLCSVPAATPTPLAYDPVMLAVMSGPQSSGHYHGGISENEARLRSSR